jgi:hypothetical protein
MKHFDVLDKYRRIIWTVLGVMLIGVLSVSGQQQGSGGASVSISSPLPAGTNVIGHVINDAGSAVIGHVINDSGSTTAVTGNVTAVQATGTNLHTVVDSAPTTAVTGTFWQATQPVSGTVSVNALPAGSSLIGYIRQQNACGSTNYESGMTYPPTASTQLTATATCVDTIYVNNTTGSAATISIQDQSTNCNSAACQVFSTFSVPANSNLELPLHGMKFVSGIKWSQGTSNALMVDIIGNQ